MTPSVGPRPTFHCVPPPECAIEHDRHDPDDLVARQLTENGHGRLRLADLACESRWVDRRQDRYLVDERPHASGLSHGPRFSDRCFKEPRRNLAIVGAIVTANKYKNGNKRRCESKAIPPS